MTVTSALLVDEVRKHESGRVDLIGLFEDIYVDSVPVTLESLSLYIELEFADSDRGKQHQLHLRVVGPDSAPIHTPPPFNFTAPTHDQYPRPTAQLDLALFEITFRSYGPHQIEILADGELARQLPLFVVSR